jgi:hypothetical protein
MFGEYSTRRLDAPLRIEDRILRIEIENWGPEDSELQIENCKLKIAN